MMKRIGLLLALYFVVVNLFAGVSGYYNVGNGNTKFSGTEGSTIAIQTGAATAFDAILKTTSYDDFEFNSGAFTADETGSAGKGGIVFRYTNSSNYYAVTNHWDRWGTGNYIIRLKNSNLSGFNSTGDIASYSNSGSVTALKILAQGTSIKIWINGVLRIDVTDANHSSGDFGFGHYTLWNTQSVSWSNVSWVESALPVDLLSFNAEVKGLGVLLDWETAVEVNNNYFEIEKSLDAENWDKIATIAGAGNSMQPIKYYEVDETGCLTTCFYRLRQVDFGGVSETFKSIVVSGGKSKSDSLKVNIYPNPVLDVINIQVLAVERAKFSIVISDATGKVVISETREYRKGYNYTKLSALYLKKGTYFVNLLKEDQPTFSGKFIVGI